MLVVYTFGLSGITLALPIQVCGWEKKYFIPEWCASEIYLSGCWIYYIKRSIAFLTFFGPIGFKIRKRSFYQWDCSFLNVTLLLSFN